MKREYLLRAYSMKEAKENNVPMWDVHSLPSYVEIRVKISPRNGFTCCGNVCMFEDEKFDEEKSIVEKNDVNNSMTFKKEGNTVTVTCPENFLILVPMRHIPGQMLLNF